MKINKRVIGAVAAVAVMGAVVAGCGNSPPDKAIEQEQKQTDQLQRNLIDKVPVPILKDSLERRNLVRRYILLSDPNKIGYVYILSRSGSPLGFYTIRGKVSSTSSQLTNPQQIACAGSGDRRACGTIDQAEPDGSYGTNGDGIFFFTTEGAYVETQADYIFSDQPLNVDAPQLIVKN